MNEIDINIEGYNVNGICVGCLNYNRKMYYSNIIKECFRILGNIEVPDGLNIQICWECLATVRRILSFQLQIQNSYQILMSYSRKHIFLNSPEDLSQYAVKRLVNGKIMEASIDNNTNIDNDVLEVEVPAITDVPMVVKEEIDYKDDMSFEEMPIGDERTDDVKDVIEPDLNTDNNFFGSPALDISDTDNEDIQLSKLKKKKVKKEKRKNKDKTKKIKHIVRSTDSKERRALQLKNYRKLKNLPEDIVQLVNMTEEEMWRIRKDDVVNPEFVKLRYKCDDCIIGFNTEKLMTDHMAGKHKSKKESCQQCDVCKSYFLTKDNVSVHRSLHLCGYHCKSCGFQTGLKRLMKRHISDNHKDKEKPVDKWSCSICDRIFNTKSKLSYHRGVCHQERPQCDCCGKVFANKMTLKYHLKILPYDKSDNKPKEKLYLPCKGKGCNKVFHSRKSYRAHVVIHDGLEYPCPVCGKLFQWKRNLARHIRNHDERDTGMFYECKPCFKRFSSKDCYNNHMKFSKKHVSPDNYVHECNYCGKKFPTKWCMVDHIDWDHLKKIKYQCQICSKAFKTAKIMVAHTNNIHDSKKNKEVEGEHLCDICGKSYKTVKRLKGHVWAMHTHRSTHKSYKCSLCPTTFTWQTSIYKHMKMMHDNNTRGKNRSHPSKKARAEPNLYEGLELARMQYFQQPQSRASNNLVVQQNMHTQTGLGNV